MVISGLTRNKQITPYKVAKFAERNGYYIEGTGTSWSLMTEGASAFGITGTEIPLSKYTVFSHLENTGPHHMQHETGRFYDSRTLYSPHQNRKRTDKSK